MRRRTPRLLLRDFLPDDWRAVLAYQSDLRYQRYYPEVTRDEPAARRFVAMLIAMAEETPRCSFQLAITLPEDGQLIGNCGLRRRSVDATEGDIGYELDPTFWGRGYATEAAREMLRFGFAELRLHRIWAECIAENRASARVLEKVGMRQEGRLREKEWMRGRWWDVLIYGILAHEWERCRMMSDTGMSDQ